MNNSDPLLNPEGGDVVWRADIAPALAPLMMRILERDNEQRAWERVKSNKGAPGSDGMTLEDFPAYAREHGSEMRQSLRHGAHRKGRLYRRCCPISYWTISTRR